VIGGSHVLLESICVELLKLGGTVLASGCLRLLL